MNLKNVVSKLGLTMSWSLDYEIQPMVHALANKGCEDSSIW